MNQLLKDEIIKQTEQLGEEQQQRVLDFARTLSSPLPRGISGEEFIRVLGTLPPEDVEAMEQALEECGRIDPRDW